MKRPKINKKRPGMAHLKRQSERLNGEFKLAKKRGKYYTNFKRNIYLPKYIMR